MRLASIWLAGLLFGSACSNPMEQNIQDGSSACQDASMKIPDPPCAPAAKGLSGTPISGTCVDFSKLTDPPVAAGWNFGFIQGSCSSWQIQNGKLKPKSNQTPGDCAFSMPRLTASDYSQYDSLTLSIIHTSNITNVGEAAKISVPAATASPPEKQLWANIDPSATDFRQITTITVSTSTLNNVEFTPKFTFRAANSTDMSTDWQIESIVIMGNKQ